jgi:NADH:ubiquinone oxidoreductase subunit 5 (subunit L)/multisubunit Na+/H+ antiporter MnhA subunit
MLVTVLLSCIPSSIKKLLAGSTIAQVVGMARCDFD